MGEMPVLADADDNGRLDAVERLCGDDLCLHLIFDVLTDAVTMIRLDGE